MMEKGSTRKKKLKSKSEEGRGRGASGWEIYALSEDLSGDYASLSGDDWSVGDPSPYASPKPDEVVVVVVRWWWWWW